MQKITTMSQTATTLKHDQLQSKCYLWAHNTYPPLRKKFWHTPNELPRIKGETQQQYLHRLNQRKAIGVVPGVLDLVFYYKTVLHVFDFKVGNDKLSDDQLEFIDQIKAEGGKEYEIRTVEQFQEIFKSIVQ
jgi:hypothetical protein